MIRHDTVFARIFNFRGHAHDWLTTGSRLGPHDWDLTTGGCFFCFLTSRLGPDDCSRPPHDSLTTGTSRLGRKVIIPLFLSVFFEIWPPHDSLTTAHDWDHDFDQIGLNFDFFDSFCKFSRLAHDCSRLGSRLLTTGNFLSTGSRLLTTGLTTGNFLSIF